MTNYPTLTIIINQHAASGHSKNILRRVIKYLKKEHVIYHICSTPKDGAQKLVRDLIDNQELDHSIPVIMGGDGTINQAINGVKDSQFPQTALAYIPAGSGNDFANGLSLSHYHEIEILQRILTAVIPKKINLGQVEINQQRHFFINNLGIGMDADMAHFANQSKLKPFFNHLHLNKLIYLSQINKVFKQGPFQVKIQIGQQYFNFEKIVLCIIANHPFIGSGIPILPAASPYENNLDLVMADQLNIVQIADLVHKILTNGQHLQSPLVHHYQLHNFSLTITSNEYGQMDGEDLGNHKFHLKFSTSSQQFWL
ncbi:diacylglycerol/lipid kinase family protein [Bombilactobacillus mellis]|uniref:diacylglycerol/lipid kinase family protein n=1 Tax=Bombilactobacillus mellis TaxID=1218508 RepID=UPI0015802D54|nr:YegS/Rv2252/BmrU family lipid kinase [Bombilactobacillus mellis]NUF25044.1 YegS/Rv2252/BmrU family lipid kinase [Bombilactobacillus mellis]